MQKFSFNPFDDYDEGLHHWIELKNGQKDGLEGLYRKFSKELFRYGMVLKPNREFIQDCIQELFLDLWKFRHNLAPTENVKVYLLKCLSNKVGREIKKENRFAGEPCPESEEEFLSIDSIEEKIISIEQNEGLIGRLRVGLGNLPLRQREVINYLFFEKLTYEETSQRLGIHVDSCYTLAWKAIKRLKCSVNF